MRGTSTDQTTIDPTTIEPVVFIDLRSSQSQSGGFIGVEGYGGWGVGVDWNWLGVHHTPNIDQKMFFLAKPRKRLELRPTWEKIHYSWSVHLQMDAPTQFFAYYIYRRGGHGPWGLGFLVFCICRQAFTNTIKTTKTNTSKTTKKQ